MEAHHILVCLELEILISEQTKFSYQTHDGLDMAVPLLGPLTAQLVSSLFLHANYSPFMFDFNDAQHTGCYYR